MSKVRTSSHDSAHNSFTWQTWRAERCAIAPEIEDLPRPGRVTKESLVQAGFDTLAGLQIAAEIKGQDFILGEREVGGERVCRCPSCGHVDNNPSASYNPSKGVWYCHPCGIGGDGFAAVKAALGTSDFQQVIQRIADWHDLGGRVLPQYHNVGTPSKRSKKAEPKKFTGTHWAKDDATGSFYKLRFVERYPYPSVEGPMMYRDRLWDTRKARKEFRWLHENERGRLMTLAGGLTPTLFTAGEGVESLRSSEILVWPEGEKDLLTAVNKLGLLGFTGAEATPDWVVIQFLTSLEPGSVVAITEDNDSPGREKGDHKASLCDLAGVRYRRVRFEDLPPKGDLTDFFDVRGRDATLDRIRSAETIHPLPRITRTDAIDALRRSEAAWLNDSDGADGEDRARFLMYAMISHAYDSGVKRIGEGGAFLKDHTRLADMQRRVELLFMDLGWSRHRCNRPELLRDIGDTIGNDLLPFDQADAEARRLSEALFVELYQYVKARRELDATEADLENEGYVGKEYKRLVQQDRGRIAEKYGVDLDHAPRVAWRFSVGVGKTRHALKMVKVLIDSIPGFTVQFLVPHSELMQGVVDAAREVGIAEDKVHNFRGRTFPGVCQVETDTFDSESGCGAISRLQGAGVSVARLCKMKDAAKGKDVLCEHLKSGQCQYFNNLDRIKANGGIVVCAHEYGAVKSVLDGVRFDVTIVDEGFSEWAYTETITEADLTRDDLFRAPIRRGESAVIDDLGLRLWRWMVDGFDKDLSDSVGINLDVLNHARGMLSKIDDDPVFIRPNMTHVELLEAVSDARKRGDGGKAKAIVRTRRLLENLCTEWEQPRPIQSVHVATSRNEDKAPSVKIERLRRLRLSENHPLLLMDATLSEPVIAGLYDRMRVYRVSARMSATIVQIANTSASQGYLATDSRRADIIRMLQAVEPGVVIGDKGFIDGAAAELSAMGARCAGYGRVTGRNDLSGCDIGAVVGRPQPRPEVVESKARALNIASPNPLNLTGEYSRVLRAYQTADGDSVGMMAQCHDDDLCQAILESIREASVVQALGRFRLVRPEHAGKLIYIVGNLPLPGVAVTSFAELEDFIGHRGPVAKLDRVVTDFGFAPMGTKGEDLARLAPVEYPTVSTAKESLRDIVTTEKVPMVLCVSSVNKISLTKDTHKLSDVLTSYLAKSGHGKLGVAEFRAGKSRRWSPMVFDGDRFQDVDLLRAHVENVLSNMGRTVIDFRIIANPTAATTDSTTPAIAENIAGADHVHADTETSDRGDAVDPEDPERVVADPYAVRRAELYRQGSLFGEDIPIQNAAAALG